MFFHNSGMCLCVWVCVVGGYFKATFRKQRARIEKSLDKDGSPLWGRGPTQVPLPESPAVGKAVNSQAPVTPSGPPGTETERCPRLRPGPSCPRQAPPGAVLAPELPAGWHACRVCMRLWVPSPCSPLPFQVSLQSAFCTLPAPAQVGLLENPAHTTPISRVQRHGERMEEAGKSMRKSPRLKDKNLW